VLKNGSGTPPTVTGSETPILTIQTIPDAPSQVTGLAGSSQLGVGTTTLTWQANPSEEGVLSYRVYRTNIADATFRLLAELPAEATTYTDNTAACSQMYLITALNGAGESLPSTASYFSLPCP
jgi:fibronectin type 3 domain-containing protein